MKFIPLFCFHIYSWLQIIIKQQNNNNNSSSDRKTHKSGNRVAAIKFRCSAHFRKWPKPGIAELETEKKLFESTPKKHIHSHIRYIFEFRNAKLKGQKRERKKFCILFRRTDKRTNKRMKSFPAAFFSTKKINNFFYKRVDIPTDDKSSSSFSSEQCNNNNNRNVSSKR